MRAALRALAIAGLALGLLTGPGCQGQQQQVSAGDLQTMKKQELQTRQGTLTGEEQMRILGIQARTRADFDEQVKRILASRGMSGTVPPAPGSQTAPAAKK